MRQHALLCHATARDCETPSAQAVARACGHAIAIAHMGAHARNIERYTRKVLSEKLLTKELEWQQAHIPYRFFSYVFCALSSVISTHVEFRKPEKSYIPVCDRYA